MAPRIRISENAHKSVIEDSPPDSRIVVCLVPKICHHAMVGVGKGRLLFQQQRCRLLFQQQRCHSSHSNIRFFMMPVTDRIRESPIDTNA